MSHFLYRRRPATTLMELLLFLAILSLVIGMILPILFSSTENRLLQQTISTVEQNGAQMMQNMGLRVRQAERILSPALGQTGSVLALQMGSGSVSPTIIGVSSGSLVIVQRATRQIISSSQVAITDFEVRNTSTSSSHQSVTITFKVSRSIRLQTPRSYGRVFVGGFNLLPDDVLIGNPCNCSAPTCVSANSYQWYVCEYPSCLTATTGLQCP
jgi:type II secretory pathway pseudopilin PulG